MLQHLTTFANKSYYKPSIQCIFFLLSMQWSNGAPRKTPLMIPWQGPFHISLNMEESTVQVFWPALRNYIRLYLGGWLNADKYMM